MAPKSKKVLSSLLGAAVVLPATVLAGVTLEEGLVRFSLTEKPDSGPVFSKHFKRQSQTTPIVGKNSGTIYTIDLTFGTPGQTVPVEFTTGESELWVNPICAKADDPAFCQAQPRFTESSSLVDLGSYGQTTYAKGSVDFAYVSDYVSLGAAKLTQQIFGVAIDSEAVSVGILGVGPNVHGWDWGYPLFLDNLKQQGFINSRAFSLDVRGLASSSGAVIFGGLDTSKYIGDLVKLPVLPPTQAPDGMTRFWVALNGISVNQAGGSVVPVLSGGNQAVVLDSGSTLSAFPSAIFNQLLAAFPGAVLEASSGLYVVDCLAPGQGGSIDFTFGSKVINVPYYEFIWHAAADKCYLGAYADDFPILGANFLRSTYAVFDSDNRNVHLAQAADCGTTLVAIGEGPDAVPSVAGACEPPASSTVVSSTSTSSSASSSSTEVSSTETSATETSTASETSTQSSATESSTTESSATETSTQTSATETSQSSATETSSESSTQTSASETSTTETSATETSATETSTESSATETSTEASSTETSTETSATETSATATSTDISSTTSSDSSTITEPPTSTQTSTDVSTSTSTDEDDECSDDETSTTETVTETSTETSATETSTDASTTETSASETSTEVSSTTSSEESTITEPPTSTETSTDVATSTSTDEDSDCEDETSTTETDVATSTEASVTESSTDVSVTETSVTETSAPETETTVTETSTDASATETSATETSASTVTASSTPSITPSSTSTHGPITTNPPRTITYTTTKTLTFTSCPPSVTTGCPASSTVITSVITATTTICPETTGTYTLTHGTKVVTLTVRPAPSDQAPVTIPSPGPGHPGHPVPASTVPGTAVPIPTVVAPGGSGPTNTPFVSVPAPVLVPSPSATTLATTTVTQGEHQHSSSISLPLVGGGSGGNDTTVPAPSTTTPPVQVGAASSNGLRGALVMGGLVIAVMAVMGL
ncbi:aspartic peptidase domain-containing protein [Podospora australis]|uniref:Aspartic peptidase domain-containing protein n=1 Tax=Podospora australis TaxID=1536484 RepID=A0AAN7AEN7_9PEZI|nr:aspartic peptidase domain-containing protein [Podospora australis]